MRYYVRGETVVARTPIKSAIAHTQIDSAIEEARERTVMKAGIVWIIDQDGNIVLSSNDVLDRLRAPKAN